MADPFNLNVCDLVNNGYFKIIDAGPLSHPNNSFNLSINESHDIEITTYSDIDSTTERVVLPAGTVCFNNESVVLKSISEDLVILEGVQVVNTNIKFDEKTGKRIRIEIASVNKITGTIKNDSDENFDIDYIRNVDEQSILWPNSSHKITENETSISIPNFKRISSQKSINNHSRNALQLTIQNIDLCLIKTSDPINKNNAIIIYKSTVDDKTRRKIRNCISFALGREMIHIGSSTYNKNQNLISFTANSTFSNVNINSYHRMMPAPLGKYQCEMGQVETNRLVNALFYRYDDYELEHVLWAYWHSLVAPIHIAAVHFGATIEAFETSYIKFHSRDFKKTLIEKSKWKEFRKGTLEIINGLDIPENERVILINKINNLNQTPNSKITERFFEMLDIELGPIETDAWKARNDAAHGNKMNESDIINTIRNVKILRCLFHRILLKAVNGSDIYYDYFSIGFPIRYVKDPIPAEKT